MDLVSWEEDMAKNRNKNRIIKIKYIYIYKEKRIVKKKVG